MRGCLPGRAAVDVLQPGEVGAQDAEHGSPIGGVELAGLAVAAGVELDDAEVSQADLPWIDGFLYPLC